MINIKRFDSNLSRIYQKIIQKHWYLLHPAHTIRKIDDYEHIYCVDPMHLIVNTTDGHIEQKMGMNTWLLLL